MNNKLEHRESTFNGFRGLRLYSQCWQPEGEAKAVLSIVHGHGEHSGRYGNVVEWFVPNGYVVYTFDLRGHGRSSGRRGHINNWDEFRQDLMIFLTLVQEQQGDCDHFLLGHSMGGLIVLDYALHHPNGLAGVIASAPTLGQPEVSPALVLVVKLLSGILPKLALDAGDDFTAISRDEEVVEAYASDPLVHSTATTRLGSELLRTAKLTQEHAADMQIPCLIVHGSADRIASVEDSRVFYESMILSDRDLQVYEGYYHEVFNDVGKEQVLSTVEAWIERHL